MGIQGDYIVEMYTEDGRLGDCLGEFFMTPVEACRAAFAYLQQAAEERAAGEYDQMSGWAFSFRICFCDDEYTGGAL
jgi:hypothetical protein